MAIELFQPHEPKTESVRQIDAVAGKNASRRARIQASKE
jgi:hypothetical protein